MGGPDRAEGGEVGERAGDRPQRADPSKHPAWDFATYGCFAQNSAGTDYKVMTLEEEQVTDWVSLMVAVNTLLGLTVLAGVLACHYYKKKYGGYEQPLDRAVLPPIYRGEDPTVFDEVLLKDGMTENYGSISNEYYDNSKNEKKIDLRIV